MPGGVHHISGNIMNNIIDMLMKFFQTKTGQWLIDIALFIAILFVSWLLFYKDAILDKIHLVH